MRFLKKQNSTTFTLFTGGHLSYTKDIISKYLKQETNNKCLILYKNYNNLTDTYYTDKPNIQIFNFDIQNQDENIELLTYLKDKKVKIIFIL
jgi:hypothetical protein